MPRPIDLSVGAFVSAFMFAHKKQTDKQDQDTGIVFLHQSINS